MDSVYKVPVAAAPSHLATIADGGIRGPRPGEGRRMILRGGRVIDPANAGAVFGAGGVFALFAMVAVMYLMMG